MEVDINNVLKEFENTLPHFPDGRINYSTSDKAPVLSCFVKYKNQILILKRSDKVIAYHGKWNSVSGFIDEPKPLYDKVLEELEEELGISKEIIAKTKIYKSYNWVDTKINKTWIVYPCLAELNRMPDIKLDWEHTDFKWIYPEELKNYDTIPNLDIGLKRVLM